MRLKKILVIKSNIPDNTKPIGDDAKLKDVAEMSVDIHLLDGRIGGGMGRHGGISGFIRVVGIIRFFCFFERFQLFDNGIGIFRIVFRYPCFNTRGVKQKHGCFFGINLLADWFGQVNKPVKQGL